MLMDDGDAEVLRLLRRVQFDRPPFNEICPSVGRLAPQMDRISVDLPAPFSPSRAWISPRRIWMIDAVERARPRVFLDQTLDLENDLGAAVCKERRPVRCGRGGPGLRRRHAHIPMSSMLWPHFLTTSAE